MEFNISASRLIEPVEFLTQPVGSDDYGQPLPRTVSFVARADVDIKGGNQLVKLGEQMTTELITCLMWYDPRALNSGWVRVYGVEYEVQHVRTSPKKTAMIITAKVERNEIPSPVIPTTRFAPSLNGFSQLAEYNGKLIDVDNLEGVVLEGYFGAGNGTLYSQNTSSSISSREFHILENGGSLACIVGGTLTSLTNSLQTPVTAGVYKFEFTATDVIFSFNDSVVTTTPYIVGAAREVDALFRIGARANGSPSSYSFFKSGLCYNHIIGSAEFKFNDGWINNPNLARTGGGQGMTAINFMNDTWIEVDL